MNPTAIINKVDKVLGKLAPPDRQAYKRTLVKSGNTLIGRTTTTYTDILLSPQPYFSRIGRERVTGYRDKSQTVIDASGKAVVADDWEFFISPSAMTQDELQNPDIVLVLKDTAGNEETMALIDFDSAGVASADVIYSVFMRSIKRP